MKTLFISQDLQELIENGYDEADISVEVLKECKKKDDKALFLIQQVVDDNIFSRIAVVIKSQGIWNALQMAYMETTKV